MLVIGAGPTGLMASYLLRRCGVDVRVIDKRAEPSAESRAGVMSSRSVELFASLGLADRVFAHGVPNSDFDIFVGGKRAGGFHFDHAHADDTPYRFITMIPQAGTEAVLIEALTDAGLVVDRSVEAKSFRDDGDAVVVEAAGADGSPLTFRARYLLGADGAHSLVRHQLGLSFEGAKYPQAFLLGDVQVDWDLPEKRFRVFLNGDRLGLYVPFQGQGAARVMTTDLDPQPTQDQAWSHLDLADLQAGFAEAAVRPVRLHDPVWLTRFSSQHRVVDRYRVGRVFVAGDAAHIHSPAGGQGMNTGLQDAANLAWKLAAVLKGDAGDALLDSYEAERLPVAHHVLELSDRMFDISASQTGWRAKLRDALAPLVIGPASQLDRVQTLAFRALSQIDVGYAEPGAARDGKAGPQAGERAPDAPLRRGRDLFDLIAGYGFTALALSRKRLDAETADRLAAGLDAMPGVTPRIAARLDMPAHPRVERVERAELFAAYGLHADDAQALLLVRPDGFVAWRGDGLDTTACQAALHQLLHAA
ncbi:NAD(P)-binding protein [Sphingomonas sp. SFZ2018-12]|uniref:FAD-dependent monooxygenase n=1 Tax=Sphingomonas sp. SFZ2018-12 TaxID=2683197 RepID=UPI001F113D4B|nr:NAD(P)-binding protein [Sphingomonas sp. SFZ2018-12]